MKEWRIVPFFFFLEIGAHEESAHGLKARPVEAGLTSMANGLGVLGS